MFKSVRIQNFRQFKDLKLDGLAQINLITGKNNTGKTSLLEALFLLVTPTNPETVLTIAQLRGMSGVAVDGIYAWGFIFRDGEHFKPVLLEGANDDGSTEQLQLRISDDLEVPIVESEGANGAPRDVMVPTTTSAGPMLESEYAVITTTGVRRGISRVRVVDRERVTQRARDFKTRPFYFLATGLADAEADAERFSRLVEARRKSEVIEVLRVIEPRLVDLEVLALRPSTVTADLGVGPLVPVAYLGRGFERLLTLVLAILGARGGTVIIDELEDGLHYSVLPDIWRAIGEAARKSSVQIFTTTYSWECLEAAVKGSEGHEGSLAFFRLDRINGSIEVVQGSDSRLRSAVRVGYEIR